MKNIHSRAMLVSLKISAWSASKYDKKISKEVAEKHGAGAEAGRYTKKLLPQNAKSYADLNAALSELRTMYYANTLAWSDEGWRLLPSANFMQFTAKVRELRVKAEAALEAFVSDYPGLREQARQALNGMFKDEDYPSPVDLKRRYSIKVDFNPLPAAEDFRIDLDSAAIAEIARDTEDRVQKAVAQAQSDAVERLHNVVSHIAEKLSDPEAIFRDSLIGNARELTEVLTRLNVTDDPRIEDLRQRVEKLAQVSPEALRTLPFQRKNTAQEASNILADMTAFFGEAAHA